MGMALRSSTNPCMLHVLYIHTSRTFYTYAVFTYAWYVFLILCGEVQTCICFMFHVFTCVYGTAILIIIDVHYQLSTVFSTSSLLENRWNHDNRRQLFWDWQYVVHVPTCMWYVVYIQSVIIDATPRFEHTHIHACTRAYVYEHQGYTQACVHPCRSIHQHDTKDCTHTHTCMCVYDHHQGVRIHACMSVSLHLCMRVSLYTKMRVYIHTRMHTNVHICMHALSVCV